MNIPRLAAILTGILCASTSAHATATLTHRYEFNGNLNDSIGTANAIAATIDGLPAALAYDAARPPEASGPVASIQIGQAADSVSGFTIPVVALSDVGSLSFWFKADRSNAGEGADYLLNMGGTYNKDLRISIAAGKDRVEINVANTNTQLGKITEDAWYHVVVTWDKTAQTANLYFNDALAKNRTWDDPARFSLAPGRVGNWAFSPKYTNNQFKGSIYDLQVYSGQLDASEVKQLYAAPGSVIGSVD
ncbi:hypothetical protein OpiT1DRAFT_01511 [Opitutaceae bacterium TAV1]|nr:hypothetical protein OpiT1DRAFT_01511 [Opitutaceae bacterium TAV1]